MKAKLPIKICHVIFIAQFIAVLEGSGENVVLMKEPKPGWVRFCSGDKQFDVFANQCPAGFFWKPGVKVGIGSGGWDCVCARGAWKSSQEWCKKEKGPRYVQGDMTCFRPENGLGGMLYLGAPESVWDTGEPVLLTSFTSGTILLKQDFRNDIKFPSTMKNNNSFVIIVRPRDDWLVEDKSSNSTVKLCLRAPYPSVFEEVDGIYIYSVSRLFSKGNKKRKISFTRSCPDRLKKDGKLWFDAIGLRIDEKKMVWPPFSNETASEHCRKCLSVPIPKPPTIDPYGNSLKTKRAKTVFDLKNMAVLTSEINLQSERLGTYWSNRLLKKGPDFVNKHVQEFELLQKAAVLAYGTCNMKYIPKEFYQYFLVMFRKLLLESFQKYATIAPIPKNYYQKITGLLEACKNRTRTIDFTVDKNCTEKSKVYVGYKYVGGTHPIPGVDDYGSNPAKHDYILEFIWRLKSFLHYHCFPEFENDSVLHDLLISQLEALFTEDLLLRWFNPSLSFKMYQHMFRTKLDLNITMNNFDKCVRVVYGVSKFPMWLKRPLDQPHTKRQHTILEIRKKRETEESAPGFQEDDYTDDTYMMLENSEPTTPRPQEKRPHPVFIPKSRNILQRGRPTSVDNIEDKDNELNLGAGATGSIEGEPQYYENEDIYSDIYDDVDDPYQSDSDGDLKKDEQPESTSTEEIFNKRSAFDKLKESIPLKKKKTTPKPKKPSKTSTTAASPIPSTTTTKPPKTSKKMSATATRKSTTTKPSRSRSSAESFYVDSDETELHHLPQPSDKVYNKFYLSKELGFAGACIESMSSFIMDSKQKFEDCW